MLNIASNSLKAIFLCSFFFHYIKSKYNDMKTFSTKNRLANFVCQFGFFLYLVTCSGALSANEHLKLNASILFTWNVWPFKYTSTKVFYNFSISWNDFKNIFTKIVIAFYRLSHRLCYLGYHHCKHELFCNRKKAQIHKPTATSWTFMCSCYSFWNEFGIIWE